MKQTPWRLTFLVLLSAGAARAEDVPSAVGRITYGDALAPGAAICSGVLVAPDLVLTAGHCVRPMADAPTVIRFDAAWAGGMPKVTGQGKVVILSETGGLAGDVALVVLKTRFSPEVAQPLQLAGPGAVGSSTGVFTLNAFRRDAPDQVSGQTICNLLATQPGLLGLDCPAVSGNSGAALLQRLGNDWFVAAIMVAASSSSSVWSWAAVPPDDLRQRIAAD